MQPYIKVLITTADNVIAADGLTATQSIQFNKILSNRLIPSRIP